MFDLNIKRFTASSPHVPNRSPLIIA